MAVGSPQVRNDRYIQLSSINAFCGNTISMVGNLLVFEWAKCIEGEDITHANVGRSGNSDIGALWNRVFLSQQKRPCRGSHIQAVSLFTTPAIDWVHLGYCSAYQFSQLSKRCAHANGNRHDMYIRLYLLRLNPLFSKYGNLFLPPVENTFEEQKGRTYIQSNESISTKSYIMYIWIILLRNVDQTRQSIPRHDKYETVLKKKHTSKGISDWHIQISRLNASVYQLPQSRIRPCELVSDHPCRSDSGLTPPMPYPGPLSPRTKLLSQRPPGESSRHVS
jgi:hypothetical protein